MRGWQPTVFGCVVLGPAQDLPITGRFMAIAYLSALLQGRCASSLKPHRGAHVGGGGLLVGAGLAARGHATSMVFQFV